MRIVHCANFNTIKLSGCYLASLGFKLNNGLTRLGHQVYCFNDREVAKMFGILGHKSFFSIPKTNKMFYKFCLNIKPDAILLGHADIIQTDTLLKIREKLQNIKILQWNVDCINPTLTDAHANVERIQQKLVGVDYTLISTADKNLLQQFNPSKNVIGYIPNAVDINIENGRVFEIENPKYDLFYATSTNRKRKVAGEQISPTEMIDLLNNNVNSKKMLFPNVNHPYLHGIEYLEKISQSASVLNVSAVNSDYLYSSDRMAHAMGNGCLAYVDERTGFKDIFTDDEIAFFKTKEELIEKMNYYISTPKERMQVAYNGWKKYHEIFNEAIIAKYVMSLLRETHNEKDYAFPTIIK